MNKDPIPLGDLTHAICERLGLDPDVVAELTIKPHKAEAIVYLRNWDGHKYVGPGDGAVAKGTAVFDISTDLSLAP